MTISQHHRHQQQQQQQQKEEEEKNKKEKDKAIPPIPIPDVKWTTSSIIKVLDRLYSDTIKAILDDDSLTKDEKNKRVDRALLVHKPIHEAILENGLVYKKSIPHHSF